MNSEVEIIMANLKAYPFLEKYFRNIIEQRLQIECYSHGVLTSHLLELTEYSKSDLDRLEIVLQFAGSCCRSFELITKEDNLSRYEDADAKIVDMLAEVRAFEFLCRYTFKDIKKIRHSRNYKTVDFTATRNNQNYAVEVTRLGLAKSNAKQPVYDRKVSTIDYEKKCEDANGWEWRLLPKETLNVSRIVNEIYDAVSNEYTQFRDFLKGKVRNWSGILFISSGEDYFLIHKYANKGYDDVPENDFKEALKQVWQYLKDEQRDKYLHHLVITRGKDLRKAIVSPVFKKSTP